MKFLTGKDYPDICPACRATIDLVALIMADAQDTDDIEAPCMRAYDRRMLCGGHECKNKADKHPPFFVEKTRKPDGTVGFGVFRYQSGDICRLLDTEADALRVCKIYNQPEFSGL